MSILSKQI